MIKIFIKLTFAIVLTTWLTSASCQSEYKRYSYIVHNSYLHATDSYTQGLQIHKGVTYESTGLYGESRLMKGVIESPDRELIANIPRAEFGEGLTILGDTLYMLTWRENTAYLFDVKSNKQIDTRSYDTEGWGLATDGEKIYMSDGSSEISIRERDTFSELSRHTVTFRGEPLSYINELEWIDGKIWANVYTTDQIVIIDPATWSVCGVVDLTGLLPASERTAETDVLNGIAYDAESGKIYVTGKNWSRLFEIEIVEI